MSIEGIGLTERFMSTGQFMSTERFTITEGFMSTENFISTERFMSTDRPFSPVIKIRESEEEMSASRIENNNEELRVFSPTQVGLFSLGFEPKEPSLPVDLQELELPAEDPNFQQFAEILTTENRNSPRRSGRNKMDKVFKFSKEDWIERLSKKDSEKPNKENSKGTF